MSDFIKDYYKILMVQPQASLTELKSAYRKLVKKYHPDLHPGNLDYENTLKEINEAYEILSDKDERYAYDQYLLYKQILESEIVEEKPLSKNQRKYTKKTTVTSKIKTWLKGGIFIKYRGMHQDIDAENIMRELFYNIRITQVDAVIQSEDIYQKVIPEEIANVFRQYKPFHLSIELPINCTVNFQDSQKYYRLNIIDLTIPHPEIINVTKDEGESFGTLTGTFYGWVEKVETYEEKVTVTECFGESGKTEEKFENDTRYYRKEYFNPDCTTYWGNWITDMLRPTVTPTGHSEYSGNYYRAQYYYSDYKKKYWGQWVYRKSTILPADHSFSNQAFSILGVALSFLVFIFVLPQLVFLLPFIFFPFLLKLLPLNFWKWFFTGIFGLLGLLFVYSAAIFFIHDNYRKKSDQELKADDRPVKSEFIPITDPSAAMKPDTLILHHVSWNDYNGKKYEGDISVKSSAFHDAHFYKESLDFSANNDHEYNQVVYSLKEYDKDKLNGLYTLFDSLQVLNKLSRKAFAEMIVSFVQHVPYTIILPDSCDASLYQDNFTARYLSTKDAKCDGNEKYGINSPVEFIATLKGDCDTRTLLLYTAFTHYNYDVALLSSAHYGHSLLGINLPYDGLAYDYNGQRYIYWETTALNIKPGILPQEISNPAYWRISLKSK